MSFTLYSIKKDMWRLWYELFYNHGEDLKKTELSISIKESEYIKNILQAYGLKFGYPINPDKEEKKQEQYENKWTKRLLK